MPLILAVEPDKKQAIKIAALAKNALKAELVVAESAEPALQILSTRVPDLILTSLLLSPKDEAALTERLRELDSVGMHVQTLGIPVLGNPKRRGSERLGASLFGRLRKGGPSSQTTDACDPAVFAGQIEEYLERASADRELRAESRLGRAEAEAQSQAAEERRFAFDPLIETPVLAAAYQRRREAEAQHIPTFVEEPIAAHEPTSPRPSRETTRSGWSDPVFVSAPQWVSEPRIEATRFEESRPEEPRLVQPPPAPISETHDSHPALQTTNALDVVEPDVAEPEIAVSIHDIVAAAIRAATADITPHLEAQELQAAPVARSPEAPTAPPPPPANAVSAKERASEEEVWQEIELDSSHHSAGAAAAAASDVVRTEAARTQIETIDLETFMSQLSTTRQSAGASSVELQSLPASRDGSDRDGEPVDPDLAAFLAAMEEIAPSVQSAAPTVISNEAPPVVEQPESRSAGRSKLPATWEAEEIRPPQAHVAVPVPAPAVTAQLVSAPAFSMSALSPDAVPRQAAAPGSNARESSASPSQEDTRTAASPPPGKTRHKSRKLRKAAQDEWGFFDPDQCGFSALLAKLDEITEDEETRAIKSS